MTWWLSSRGQGSLRSALACPTAPGHLGLKQFGPSVLEGHIFHSFPAQGLLSDPQMNQL